MALGVGGLGPEGGAEGVHVAEGHGEVLGVELAGDGQVGALAEEVLGVVHLAVGGLGHVVQVQGGDPEHLAGAFAVAGGDDGGVDVDKAPVLEEAVDGVGRHAAHPEHGGEQVGPGPQVLDGPQVLHGVALLLERVVGSGDLQGLLGLGRQHHGAHHRQGGPHVLGGDLLVVGEDIGVHDHLEVLEAGPVVELDEAEGLHVPDGPGPAADGDGLAAQGFTVGEDRRDFCSFHMSHLISSKSGNLQKYPYYIAGRPILQGVLPEILEKPP